MSDPTEPIETKRESLCSGCANPCMSKSDDKVQCKDYSEFIKEKCLQCEYWDVETCMFNGTCKGAENYVGPEAISV